MQDNDVGGIDFVVRTVGYAPGQKPRSRTQVRMGEDPEEEHVDTDQEEPFPSESQAMDTDNAESNAKMFAALFGKDCLPEQVKFQHAPKVTMSAEHLPKSMKLHVSQTSRSKPVVYRAAQVDPSVYYQAFNSAAALALASVRLWLCAYDSVCVCVCV